MDFSEGIILSMTSFRREVNRGSRVVDLRHVKEPQAEIRASDCEQNLSDFSRSILEAKLKTQDVKKCRKTQQQQQQQQQQFGSAAGDWIDLAQDKNQWRAYVGTVMNLRVVKNSLVRVGLLLYIGYTEW